MTGRSAGAWACPRMARWCACVSCRALAGKESGARSSRVSPRRPADPGCCAEDVPAGAVAPVARARRRTARRASSARMSSRSRSACRRARNEGVPRASSASGSRRAHRPAWRCTAPTASTPPARRATRARCWTEARPRARCGWAVCGSAARGSPRVRRGSSASRGPVNDPVSPTSPRPAARASAACGTTRPGRGVAGRSGLLPLNPAGEGRRCGC
jgi:hypothetical protein